METGLNSLFVFGIGTILEIFQLEVKVLHVIDALNILVMYLTLRGGIILMNGGLTLSYPTKFDLGNIM